MAMYQRALCWVRRDLRLRDHTALAAATRQTREVIVVFVFDTNILRNLEDKDDRRLTFIHHSLQDMQRRLVKKGSSLLVCHGDPVLDIPRLAQDLKVQAVFTNRDYDPYARKRDRIVEQKLKISDVAFHSYMDQVVFEHPDIVTRQGEPYKVFTPYKNAWLAALRPEQLVEEKPNLKRLAQAKVFEKWSDPWSLKALGFEENDLWLKAGEEGARAAWKKFQKHMHRYHRDRDFPSRNHGTSGLSAHLRFGTISIRELVRTALTQKDEGARAWLTELIWRDFYQTILDRFSYVVRGAFRSEYDRIQWPGKPEHFEKWCRGETGYPLVDAAMRHFERTGWMHNRLRMVVASFLVKDLLIDWRWGEAWFARKLLDFDLASNNGGWQWCASTGCDAQPWFRIFNPVTQSKHFDPEGRFLRAHLPELAGFSNTHIHWPHEAPASEQEKAGCRLGRDYPTPIVDHAAQREKALKLFEGVSQTVLAPVEES
ncbi:cryptochrome/photolyase family protein [Nitrospina watsonii]|uniref:Deoxyribodipyrimidine photo-lyase n=1 Tax=Nitrospina watsonii TaxID=1323948 RepID=A0ABM9HFP5_9BACT|nr:deoxyribodipyrimidine photo-lyase [Nitrospina watsonii]CAI2719148.1 Deoxyribodipyrimidine photo-lyase [Nitrospina watsonii]